MGSNTAHGSHETIDFKRREAINLWYTSGIVTYHEANLLPAQLYQNMPFQALRSLRKGWRGR